MNVSIDLLLAMVGEREVQLQLLRTEIATLKAALEAITPSLPLQVPDGT